MVYLLAASALCFAAGLAVLGAWVLLLLCVLAGAALLIARRLRPAGPTGKLVGIAAAFVATGLGVAQSVRGERFQTWTPPASARG